MRAKENNMRRFITACSLLVLVGCQGASDPPDDARDTDAAPAVAAGISADTL